MENNLLIGIDVGSTTVKIAALDENNNLIYQNYMRHYSDLYTSVEAVLSDAKKHLGDVHAKIACTGSGGLGVSQKLGIQFVQEVIAAAKTVRTFIPQTDVAIELGGEDAKITFFSGTVEQRMNGTCAGGTGAFIDQMATLMGTDAAGVNTLAQEHKVIYPIAARCGVFAKSDVQPLLNEGASREDIAASIFQAVVNQTIGGLACGRPIRGNVAYLGGPLSFMPELRKLFSKTLNLTPEQIIEPKDGKMYVAMGCALMADGKARSFSKLITDWQNAKRTGGEEFSLQSLDVLFESPEDYTKFKARHDKATVIRADLSDYIGNCYLGIDAGSTTTKMVLLGDDAQILADYYSQNKGNPLEVMKVFLEDLYDKLPDGANIVYSGVTGYGEALIQSAFGVDAGEVETVAHFTAASYFDPEVEFLLDIGGQDMKCITIKDGIINQVILNEACSSGCGSFIESLSKSMELEVSEFAGKALFAKNPMDLGTRCTVFMNSRIKQVQKEGADVGDISAGLSYSVIKNALYKVIKLRNPENLGGHIVVQGGTFLNDAVLRATEIITGREVVRPQIAGLMGAFGAALIARERYSEGETSTLCDLQALNEFTVKKTHTRCKGCENSCLLTINVFSNGQRHLSGNKCEKGAGVANMNSHLPNLFALKNKMLFDYESLDTKNAPRGTVGIPRGLNMFENYPLWHTFFTELGYSVVLSSPSSKTIFEKGLESIPSESECYPAKLMHGHIMDLIEKQVDFIFYPCIPYDGKEFDGADNHYNCPIVASYAENIKNNVEPIRDGTMPFMRPFLTLHDTKVLSAQLTEAFGEKGISQKEIRHAVKKAEAELNHFRHKMRKEGERVLHNVKSGKYPGIVLAGRPYHADHEIHHGIPAIINQLGFAVLTEDSIAQLDSDYKRLRILDQWVYHSRLYAAAQVVGETDGLELVQLNSFGCGLDAITSDQVEEILKAYGKTFTLIKIDEVSNLGAARIRLRSLKAAIQERMESDSKRERTKYKPYSPAMFEAHMKDEYTIIAPQMSPIHFSLLEHSFKMGGYKLTILPEVSKNAKELGLKYVNNDACYPAIIVIGQLMEAIDSGEYDLDKLAVMMSQTGGACRASNYLSLLRKALADRGLSHIPAISLSTGLEKHPGFKISTKMLVSAVFSLLYGDLFNRLVLRTRPYEKVKGSTDALHKKWESIAVRNLYNIKFTEFRRNIKQIIKEFDELEIEGSRKPRVGVVGEILVKFHPGGNNELVATLEKLGAEASVPDLYDFLLYSAASKEYQASRMMPSKIAKFGYNRLIDFMEWLRKPVKRELKKHDKFDNITSIRHIAEGAKPFLSLGNRAGEGWFLTGEMVELIEHGVGNIVCTQPFACLPNHIVGKGTVRTLRDAYPHSNIVPIDYDPGDTNVNQINRIELMLSVARERELFKQG